MDTTTINGEAILEQVKLYRAAFGKDPKFICIISNGPDPSGMQWMADNLAINTTHSDYPGCFNGLLHGLGNTITTPSQYAGALFPNTLLTIIEFKPELLESSNTNITIVGNCRCSFDNAEISSDCMIFDCLNIIGRYTTKDAITDLVRVLYIESVRVCLHNKDQWVDELRFDFPTFQWMVDEGLTLGSVISELKLTTSIFSLSKIIMNSDAEDRFAEDYNPHEIKMMRLLPTDAFTMPQNILDLIKEMRHYMLKSIALSGALPPTSGALKKAFRSVDDTYARRLLFTHFVDSHVHTLIFFKDGDPFAFLDYENTPGNKIHLHTLYLKEAYRSKGYGSWILQQFFAEVYLMPDSLPVADMEMFVTERKITENLMSFYRKHGFEISGTVTNLLMEKDKFRKLADSLI